MNTIKRAFPLDRYPSANRPEDYITIELPEIVKNYKQVKVADKKMDCKKSISHKTKTLSETSYNEILWITHRYQEEK